MKQGDEVKTPEGQGIFFGIDEDNADKCLIRLVKPAKGAVWYPLIDINRPIFDCFECNSYKLSEITLTKTFEERQREANMRAREDQARRQAELNAKMNAFNEARKQQNK